MEKEMMTVKVSVEHRKIKQSFKEKRKTCVTVKSKDEQSLLGEGGNTGYIVKNRGLYKGEELAKNYLFKSY